MRFVDIDLSQLPAPALIEEIDYEAIRAEQIAWVQARWAELRAANPDLPALDTLGLETEPMTIVLEAYAYRETLLRALINDKARSVMVAFAGGSNLDHLAALFGVSRMVMTPATDFSPAVMEDDERFRRRIQLAPDAYSTAGARGAYIYHALTCSPEIADAWAWSPRDGEVHVMVAGADGAAVSDAVVADLVDFLQRADVRPLTDVVVVRRAVLVPYAIEATLIVPRGPDPALIEVAAELAIRAHAASRYRIAGAVYRAGLTVAAKVGGVDNVLLASPLADVTCADAEIAHLSGVTLHTVVT